MKREMPTMPSLPTTAISAEAPSSITYSSETMAVVGRYTWATLLPDSKSTWPSGISTGSSCGNQCARSASGSARSSRFCSGSTVKTTGTPGAIFACNFTISPMVEVLDGPHGSSGAACGTVRCRTDVARRRAQPAQAFGMERAAAVIARPNRGSACICSHWSTARRPIARIS